MSRVTAIILCSGYLHHRLGLSWAVNHYRDNAITYKAQRDKNARELKLANAAITDMQMRRLYARCCCTGCKKYTKSLVDAKAENDALRDDVAAGRRRRLGIIKAVCQSVREATTASGVDNAASPRLADTADLDYFTLRREADHYATTGRNPEVLMSSADRVAHIDGHHAIIVSNTHALPAEYKCLKACKNRAIHLRMFAGFLF